MLEKAIDKRPSRENHNESLNLWCPPALICNPAQMALPGF
jgi:hypothetical protein